MANSGSSRSLITHPDGEGYNRDATWLTLSDVAEYMNVPVSKIRQMLRDRQLIAISMEARGRCIPASFFAHGLPLPELPGTLTLLADAGFNDEEAVLWLLHEDSTLREGSPIDALRAGHKTEVRRRAQALAL
ncbi:MAG: Rv2175c family DNA-binding protein [Actinomycetota bacterium]